MAQSSDFGNWAVKLFGEFRRLPLAAKEYRSAAAGKLAAVAAEDRRAEPRCVLFDSWRPHRHSHRRTMGCPKSYSSAHDLGGRCLRRI